MKINELVLRNRFVVEAGPVPPVDDPAAAPAATTPPAAAPAAKGPGILDKLKAGVAGWKAGAEASKAQRAGKERAQEIAAEFIQRWNKAIAQNPAANTPAQLQAYMTKSTQGSGIKVPTPPAELNDVTTAKYINDAIAQSLSARALGAPAGAEAEPAEQQPTGPALAPGVAVTSENPLVLKYKGQDYAVNDQGQWAKSTNQNAVLSQTMQAFLDTQEKAILDYKPPAAQQKPQLQQTQQQTQAQAKAPADEPAADASSAMGRLNNITGYADNSTTVTPTDVTQTTTAQLAPPIDDIIANSNKEDLAALLASLEGSAT
jgi:hypothetical protein